MRIQRSIGALAYCAAAYLCAGAAAAVTAGALRALHPLAAAALADTAATCVVFLFSLGVRNSSIYDPYWSVAPLPLALYFLASSGAGLTLRTAAVLVLVTAWSVRLTWNCVSQWRGFAHEDWRYLHFRKLCGRWYWPVSFTGIHLMPTLCVFCGCLSLYTVTASGARPAGPLDAAAFLVTLSAIWIEARADFELRRFTASRRKAGDVITTGLWRLTRHPNYFGEILFWWGLFLFSTAAAPLMLWPVLGPLIITALFLFVSIPLTEKRLLERHPGYARTMKTTSGLVPWFPGKESAPAETAGSGKAEAEKR